MGEVINGTLTSFLPKVMIEKEKYKILYPFDLWHSFWFLANYM